MIGEIAASGGCVGRGGSNRTAGGVTGRDVLAAAAVVAGTVTSGVVRRGVATGTGGLGHRFAFSGLARRSRHWPPLEPLDAVAQLTDLLIVLLGPPPDLKAYEQHAKREENVEHHTHSVAI
jgi:hypothetical protein